MVATVIGGVSEEDAGHGPWTELVRRGRRQVGVAQGAKDSKLAVVRIDAEKKLVWGGRASCTTWTPVDEERRRGEGLCPELWRSCTMKK